MTCEKCGNTYDDVVWHDRCPYCGWEMRNRPTLESRPTLATRRGGKVRLQSEGDVYYEYNESTPPIKKDAWGRYYIGDCFSKKDNSLMKKVSVCVADSSIEDNYFFAMWNLLKSKNIDFSQTALIPIVDYIKGHLIEDRYYGVSLFDIMHGQVRDANGQRIDFADKMYEMFQSNRVDFAKTVAKKILKAAKFMYDHKIGVNYIEPLENIIFTDSSEIKIRMINSLAGLKVHGCIPGWIMMEMFPIEYSDPYQGLISDEVRHGDSYFVYAVGVQLYCIMTGHLPYQGGPTVEDCHLKYSRGYIDPRDDDYETEPRPHLFMPHPYERLLLEEIEDTHLRKIIEKATSSVPWKRYHSATELINALDNDEMPQKENMLLYKRMWGLGFLTILILLLLSWLYLK